MGRILREFGLSRQKARPSHPEKTRPRRRPLKSPSAAQKGRVCRVWWKRGERPPGLCDKGFTFADIFAAVEPGTDNAFALVLPSVGTEAMQAFLDDFVKTIGPARRDGS